jgi:D-inositol-3-phosphate glycosyltransferase
MRILFATHYALPHVGGVEVITDQLARELRARGHEVEQITGNVPRHGAADRPGGALVRRARAWNVIEDRTGIPYPLYGPGFINLARHRVAWADVVHAHGFLFLPSVVSLAVARRHARRAGGPARVLTEHGARGAYGSRAVTALETVAIRTIGSASLRSAQAVISLNTRITDFIHGLRPETRVVDLPNGIDTSVYRPPSEEEKRALREELGWDERPRALFVGRLIPRKGADLAMAAARALEGRMELVLAGPGTPQDSPPNAVALGELPPERVAELYRAADCFVLPSTAEGFPGTVQQALASGLPTVLTDDPTYAPYLEGAPEGVVLIERTTKGVIEGLRSIDSGSAIGQEERRRLAEFAASRYSLERWVERHEALYQELIEENDR